MRVLIATPLYPPEPGGPATYSKLLEDGLPALGIEVVLVKFAEVRHRSKIFRHTAYFWRVLRAAKGADLIYALDPVSVGLPSLLASWISRKPLIVKIVGDYAWEQGRQRFSVAATLDEFVRQRWISPPLYLYRWIQMIVARSAARIIVPSHYLESIVALWGVHRSDIQVIWNAIHLEPPSAPPQKVRELPKPIVVSVGRLVPWKGFFELIAAMQLIAQDGVAASLAIVGDGPDRAFLEKEAAERLKSSVVFTGGISHEQTLATIASSDIFVLDSLYEGLSHTLIEALTLGVPVVVSDIGGNTEIVRHQDNGLVVSPEDPRALADALGQLIKDPSLRARLAAAAKASSKDFAVETMLQKTAESLRSIL